jgi:hypothetical protein
MCIGLLQPRPAVAQQRDSFIWRQHGQKTQRGLELRKLFSKQVYIVQILVSSISLQA